VLPGEHSIFDYGLLASNGSNIKVVNNGHTVQVVSGEAWQYHCSGSSSSSSRRGHLRPHSASGEVGTIKSFMMVAAAEVLL
jgi:hypothetical protein